jgi:hypothetical protein
VHISWKAVWRAPAACDVCAAVGGKQRDWCTQQMDGSRWTLAARTARDVRSSWSGQGRRLQRMPRANGAAVLVTSVMLGKDAINRWLCRQPLERGFVCRWGAASM